MTPWLGGGALSFPLRESSRKRLAPSLNSHPRPCYTKLGFLLSRGEPSGRALMGAASGGSADFPASRPVNARWADPPSRSPPRGSPYDFDALCFSSCSHTARNRPARSPRRSGFRYRSDSWHGCRCLRQPHRPGIHRGGEHCHRRSLHRDQRRRGPLRPGTAASWGLLGPRGRRGHVTPGHAPVARGRGRRR